MRKFENWFFKSRWRSLALNVICVILAFGGAVVAFDQNPGNFPAYLRPFGIVAFIVGLGGIAILVVVRQWRSSFRRQFEANLPRQEDGSYIARHFLGRRKGIDVYRIDEATRERILAWMLNGSTACNALFVLLAIGASAGSVIWGNSLILPILVPSLAIFFVARHWINRRTDALAATGTLIRHETWTKPERSLAAGNVDRRRPIIVIALCVMVAWALLAIFVVDFDTGDITAGTDPVFVFFLIALPVFVIILVLRVLRQERRAGQ